MNTSQLKRFAQEARTKLITLVSGKLDAVLTQDNASLRGKTHVIQKLQVELERIGKTALVDKVAYTWFNRLVALRFMDANEFQPLGINILSPAAGQAIGSPQILNDIHAGIFPEDLKLDTKYINDVLNGTIASNNPDNDIFRHILIAVCNDLHRIFPFLFERIDDYTELLLPDDLTSAFSIVADVVNGMSTEDCQEVEIIGWLYQFYISEKKDEVFATKSKVKKEDIPAATQLFTPRWIVEYMVQNTVGKLWLQNNPQSTLAQHMPYYIASVEGNTEEYLKISSVEEIKLLDQACGSGHILVYGFELLAKIYEEQGFNASEIPAKIIEHNLFGLEIDERAAQLAALAITMKARQYYRRFFRKVATPHITCYQDIQFSKEEIAQIIAHYGIAEKDAFTYDLSLLEQATNLGSLIQPKCSSDGLQALAAQVAAEGDSADLFWQATQVKVKHALRQLLPLAQKYHCVVDNPPYMGGGNMNADLADFVKKNYPKSKADLMACFMEAGLQAMYPKGLLGMINQHSWMFLSSYEELRKHLIENIHIDTLLHLGPRTFPEIGGEVVQNAAFTLVNAVSSSKGKYIRLVDFDASELKRQKTLEAIQNPNSDTLYLSYQVNFLKVPGKRIGYFVSSISISKFQESIPVLALGEARRGLQPGKPDKYKRRWFEVSDNKTLAGYKNREESIIQSKFKKWSYYNDGGETTKWYGTLNYVIDWLNNGNNIKQVPQAIVPNEHLYFIGGVTWSKISNSISARYLEDGLISGDAAPIFICKEQYNINDRLYVLTFLNSKVVKELLKLLSATTNLTTGNVGEIPFVKTLKYRDSILISGDTNVKICKNIWNSRETSWDFLQNELVRFGGVDIHSAVNSYKDYWSLQFHTLHQNEEELNRQFIEIYGLQDELTPDVPFEDITILKDEAEIVEGALVFKEQELVAQFISYAIGCVFGRYSLDKEGLILANQGETLEDYIAKVGKAETELSFVPDEDNVIPVLEEEWFDDDIVNRVKEFVRAVWGDATYQDNIQYIESTLGKDLRKYLTKDFYKDHIKRYKKRPIYWLFSSPKGHFSVLIYMHRYTPDTLNMILNDYLRPFIKKVENDLFRQEQIIISGTAAEQGRARKRQTKLNDILKDCSDYERDILFPLAGERIAIDLDEGVLVNYNKFGKAIAAVAGLNDAKTKQKVKDFDWIDRDTIR